MQKTLLEVVALFIALIVVMVLWAYAYPQTHCDTSNKYK
jgi:hypothetical protein